MSAPPRWLVAVALLCLASLAAVRAEPEQPKVKLSKDEQRLLDLTNQARVKEKLPALTPNAVLVEVARAHSANMAKKGEMNHILDGKTPADRVKAAGYVYSWMGENIATADDDVPADIFKGWMDSKHHRDNILSDHYEEIGIGLARNDKGDYYYTQVFGRPRKKSGD